MILRKGSEGFPCFCWTTLSQAGKDKRRGNQGPSTIKGARWPRPGIHTSLIPADANPNGRALVLMVHGGARGFAQICRRGGRIQMSTSGDSISMGLARLDNRGYGS